MSRIYMPVLGAWISPNAAKQSEQSAGGDARCGSWRIVLAPFQGATFGRMSVRCAWIRWFSLAEARFTTGSFLASLRLTAKTHAVEMVEGGGTAHS